MFKLKFKQKMKPNFLLCLTLRRKTLEIHVRISRVTTNHYDLVLFLHKIKAKRTLPFRPLIKLLNLQNYCQKAGVNYESLS